MKKPERGDEPMRADRSATGIVFNIQKYSVNDGPGIRTVVFLKGCPLRCAWCANPESQRIQPQLLWERAKCLGCGRCKGACPEGAIEIIDARVRIHAQACTLCGDCVRECLGKALKMEGERRCVQEVMDVVMQDLPFYEESGGGLTLSGGELLMQPDFARNLLLAAKEEGLHTCCETTGFVQPEIFERVIRLVDTVLMDVKHWDDAAHRRGTGMGNALPAKNLRRAIEMGKDVLPRIPVIPGFNDALSDAVQLAKHLKSLGARRCQLLPFHQFGENKYDLLGQDYAYRDVPALHREELEPYRQAMIENEIDAFF